MAGFYWGNQNDFDELDYYNGRFMGFAQATVTNLPATLSVDADTVNRKIAYRAIEIVLRVHVAYTNTATRPTLVRSGSGSSRAKTAWTVRGRGRSPRESSPTRPRRASFASARKSSSSAR